MGLQILAQALDLTGLEASGVQWSVDSMSGMGGVKPTINVVQKPRQAGGYAGDSFAQPRHIGISGQVAAPSQALLTDAIDRLNKAIDFALFQLTVVEDVRTRFFNVRREDEVLFQYISDKMAAWSIQVVAPDPRKLYAALTGSTSLPSSTGGPTIPFTIPFPISATQVSGQVTLTNPGNETGPVLLRIDGPCTGPIVSHSSGKVLAFSAGFVLNAGEWLVIDVDKKTVLGNGQANRSLYVTTRGYVGFQPGVNIWYFSAAGYDPASLLTVTATPADK